MREIQCISHMLEIFDFKQVGVQRSIASCTRNIKYFFVFNPKPRLSLTNKNEFPKHLNNGYALLCRMVRPRKIKLVNFKPDVTYFKPRAVPLRELREIELTIDELETLRLSNLEKVSQADAAKKMKIHQSTFQRTQTRAREKITDALVNGKAIKIRGGEYKMPGGDRTGPLGQGIRGRGLGRGMGTGRGRMQGPFSAGPEGMCKCPKCGHEQTHATGQPCNKIKCAKCGTLMTRT